MYPTRANILALSKHPLGIFLPQAPRYAKASFAVELDVQHEQREVKWKEPLGLLSQKSR